MTGPAAITARTLPRRYIIALVVVISSSATGCSIGDASPDSLATHRSTSRPLVVDGHEFSPELLPTDTDVPLTDTLPTAQKPMPLVNPDERRRRVVCPVRTAGKVIRLALDLPVDMTPSQPGRRSAKGSCSYEEWITAFLASGDFQRFKISASVQPLRDTQELVHSYERAKPYFTHGDANGDDAVPELAFQREVGTFSGVTRGQTLAEWCFCDGQDSITQVVTGGGLRLQWSYAFHGAAADVRRVMAKTQDDIQHALALAGVAPADRG